MTSLSTQCCGKSVIKIRTLEWVKSNAIMPLIEDKSIRDLQDRYNKIGCCVDLCAFDVSEADLSDYDISLDAAMMGMHVFKNRDAEWRTAGYSWIGIIDGVVPKGEGITMAAFLGDGYIMKTRQVELFTWHENFQSTEVTDGLAYALLNPPHGVRLRDGENKLPLQHGPREKKIITEFFHLFLNEALLCQDPRDSENLIIYKWSDNWSTYFEPGKEWWGTFYWSVLDKKRKKITIIAASTTD